MRRSCLVRWGLCGLSLSAWLLAIGCNPVREDRTISFSKDGKTVAFQHDHEGVYVANADGTGLIKIFQPNEKVLATSRPMTSPTDGRLIFATAEAIDGSARHETYVSKLVPAEGRLMRSMPVRYTVWMRSEEQPGKPATVNQLFTANCNHLGYVGAGLAVRWHPSGKRLLYIADSKGGQSIFEYALDTGKSRPVFPHAAGAIVFNWTPAGTHLVCVTAQRENGRLKPDGSNGIWVGNIEDSASWWRVDGSENFAETELDSVIESLRASIPAWSQDETQLAYVSQRIGWFGVPGAGQLLQHVDAATRRVTTLTESTGQFTDLHWSPDSKRLGFLDRPRPAVSGRILLSSRTWNILEALATPETERNVLRMWEPKKEVVALPSGISVSRFAGFDATGNQLAYLAPVPLERPRQSQWTTLLLPDLTARDRVFIANATDWTGSSAEEVLSGMRVTFPKWSPTEPRLSLWGTFTPRYVSLLSLLGIRGIQPGDPAATFDARTKKLTWMAVSPQEQLQIGHYWLLKNNPLEAWNWYQRARTKLTPLPVPQNWQEFAQRLESSENTVLYEAICLDKLGRHDEAASRRAEFEKTFFPANTATTDVENSSPSAAAVTDLIGAFPELGQQLLHDLYTAEVYLSVDALDPAIKYFSQPVQQPESDATRLSRTLLLSQLLLMSGDHAGYATHCSETIGPLAIRIWQNATARSKAEKGDRASARGLLSSLESSLLKISVGAALSPLLHPQFVAGLSEPVLRKSTAAWRQLRNGLPDDDRALGIDLLLRAAYRKLGDQSELQAAEARLARNPHKLGLLDGGTDKFDQGLIQTFQWLQQGGSLDRIGST